MLRPRSAPRLLALSLLAALTAFVPARDAAADTADDIRALKTRSQYLEKQLNDLIRRRDIAMDAEEKVIDRDAQKKQARSDIRHIRYVACTDARTAFDAITARLRDARKALDGFDKELKKLNDGIAAGRDKAELRKEYDRLYKEIASIRPDLGSSSPLWKRYREARQAADADYLAKSKPRAEKAEADVRASGKDAMAYTLAHGRFAEILQRARRRSSELKRQADKLLKVTLTTSQHKVLHRAYELIRQVREIGERKWRKKANVTDVERDVVWFMDGVERRRKELVSKPCIKVDVRNRVDAEIRQARTDASNALAELEQGPGALLAPPTLQHPWEKHTGAQVLKQQKALKATLVYRLILVRKNGSRVNFYVFRDAQGKTWRLHSGRIGMRAWDDAKFQKSLRTTKPDEASPYPEYSRVAYRQTAKGQNLELWYPAK